MATGLTGSLAGVSNQASHAVADTAQSVARGVSQTASGLGVGSLSRGALPNLFGSVVQGFAGMASAVLGGLPGALTSEPASTKESRASDEGSGAGAGEGGAKSQSKASTAQGTASTGEAAGGATGNSGASKGKGSAGKAGAS